MNMSELFKSAHAMTKRIKQDSDDYRVTFGACLKELISILKSAEQQTHTKKLTASGIIYDCLNDIFISRKDVVAIRSIIVATIDKAKLENKIIKVSNFYLALNLLNSFYDCKGYYMYNDLNMNNKCKNCNKL